MASCIVWREKGPGDRRSTTTIAEPQGLALTPSPTHWGGVNMSGLRRGHTPEPRMGWRPVECQAHASPAAGCKNGLLMEVS